METIAKIIDIILIALYLLVLSATFYQGPPSYNFKQNTLDNAEVVVRENCEYYVFHTTEGHCIYTHKGNCSNPIHEK